MKTECNRSPIWCIAISFVLLFLLSANMQSAFGAPEENGLGYEIEIQKGIKAPDFTLESILKEKMSLKDFTGKTLVLLFGFSKQTAKDIEQWRGRIFSEFKEKGVICLKIIHINKPLFLTKDFILNKMRGEYKTEEPLKYLCIDWGGTLELDKKYGVRSKEDPALFIIGNNGDLLYGFQGWCKEQNIVKLNQELSKILRIGEAAYLKRASINPNKVYRIGVTRIMYHPSFVFAQQGFKTALEDAGYIEGKNAVYDFQDSKADPKTIVPIANKFINDKVDLIHSMSIMSSQELVKVVKEIPIIYSMVMNPVEEKVVPTLEATGTNVTGVATPFCALEDRWPVNSQIRMYQRFVPKVKKWGTIYNLNSVNTKFHINELKDSIQTMGLQLVEIPIAKPEEAIPAVKALIGKADAIFITSDEMAMNAFEKIAEICNQNKIPLFAGEVECVPKGAIAAYNQDYFLIGYKAGQKAIRVMNGEKPGNIPSDQTKKFSLVISPSNGIKQGIVIPAELKKEADKVI